MKVIDRVFRLDSADRSASRTNSFAHGGNERRDIIFDY